MAPDELFDVDFFETMNIFFRRAIRVSVAGLLTAGMCNADTLRDVYALALKNDPKLRGAEATYQADLEVEKQARARLLPQLNAEGSYNDTHRHQNYEVANLLAGTTDTSQRSTVRSTAWSVELQQPLFDLPAWFSYRSGQSATDQAEAQFAFEQQELIVRTAEAYFAVLGEMDKVSADRAEETATQEQMNQAQERFNAGFVGVADVQQARAAYKASVAQRIMDEGNLSAALQALSILTGATHENLDILRESFPITEPLPEDRGEWVQFAVANNLELKAAMAAMQAASENSMAKASEHMPKVTGSLSYQESDAHGDQVTRPDTPFASQPDNDMYASAAIVRVSVPLFSSGYTSSQSRQAYAQYNVALEKKIEIERTIVQQTRARHISANANVQRVHAQKEAIDAAQTALDATQAGYKAGTRSVVDVLISQRALFAARRDYATGRYEYITDVLKLKSLAGVLSPTDIYELDSWLGKDIGAANK